MTQREQEEEEEEGENVELITYGFAVSKNIKPFIEYSLTIILNY